MKTTSIDVQRKLNWCPVSFTVYREGLIFWSSFEDRAEKYNTLLRYAAGSQKRQRLYNDKK